MDWVEICFGECCDTARLYLTITTPEGCTTTTEWTFYVEHPPLATISGPVIAEVGDTFFYSIPDPENPCYLYVWEVETCGEIVSGQGTGIIGVEWTDFLTNDGWGKIYVEVYDTCTGCCNIDSLMVHILPAGTLGNDTISGQVRYDNSIDTPLNGVEVTLWNDGIPVFTTESFVKFVELGGGDSSYTIPGYYEFPDINGATLFGVTASYDAPWIDANATDALAIMINYVNPLNPPFWTDLTEEAADVNSSGSNNATDALWVMQRAVHLVNFFPAGDWAFLPNDETYGGTHDIYTINYGDVNMSNLPGSGKDMPAITLATDGTINVVQGEVFDMPIRVADAVTLGAITLNLGYNSNLLEVVEVIGLEGTVSNTTPTNIALAWSDLNSVNLNNNDAIVTLRLIALSEITSSDQLFTVEYGTEFADPGLNVLEDVRLKIFGISTEPAATDYFLSYNRPNPFSTSTQIEYTLPESGKVRLSVVDLLGQEIAVLINQTQSAGSYTVQFNAAGMSSGVYIYKITVQGESRDFIETRRMVISQ
jgi:hypothetical protein